MKIRPLEVDLFHADGRTDRHDDAKQFFFTILRKHLRREQEPFFLLFRMCYFA